MPLVDANLPVALLRSIFEEQRSGAVEILALVDAPPEPVREPLGIVTAHDLLTAALAAARPAADAEAAELATAVNLLYESSLAAIDLLKVHSAMPRVPRGRARPTEASG